MYYYSLSSLKLVIQGAIYGSIIWVIKGDTKNLDIGSCTTSWHGQTPKPEADLRSLHPESSARSLFCLLLLVSLPLLLLLLLLLLQVLRDPEPQEENLQACVDALLEDEGVDEW